MPSLSLTTVTGPVYMPNGQMTPFGGRISFELSSFTSEDDVGGIVSGPVYADIDANGDFSLNLFTSTNSADSVYYDIYVLWLEDTFAKSYINKSYQTYDNGNMKKQYIGRVSITGTGPFRLDELTIVSELQTNNFDVYQEVLSLRNEIVTISENYIRSSFNVRSDFVTANLNNQYSNVDNGFEVRVGGDSYIKENSSTAIPDLLGFIPATNSVKITHFTDKGDTEEDAYNELQAAIDWVCGDHGRTLDGLGINHKTSQTLTLSNTNRSSIKNLNLSPHSTWSNIGTADNTSIWPISGVQNTLSNVNGDKVVSFGVVPKVDEINSPNPEDHSSTALIYIPVGAGGIEISYCFLDGRNSSGIPVANGILWRSGGNHVHNNICRGFPDFGIWVHKGTDGKCHQNECFQWAFNQTENGQKAKRTAAGIVLGTGDIEWESNVSHGCLFPAYFYGSSASTVSNDHYYNGASSGDVLSSGKTYNAVVLKGSRPVFNGSYFDKGILRLETAQVQIQGGRFLSNDVAIYDPFYVEFAPQSQTDTLNGFLMVGVDFQGGKNGNTSSFDESDFFRIDNTNGTLNGSQDNVIVENNSYHKGQGFGSRVPSTSGTFRNAIALSEWVSSDGAFKSGVIDVSGLFLPNAVGYNFIFSVESDAGNAPYIGHPVFLQKVSSNQIQFWTNTAFDAKIHTSFDGKANTII